MIPRNLLAACALGFFAVLVGGCGEQPMVFKQGQYQGKPDSKPWDNARFKGDQVEWEKAVKARNQGQDDYSRMTASGK